ncbi:MAG: hypothetical protein WDW38_007883 [Sanguina aurantia]
MAPGDPAACLSSCRIAWSIRQCGRVTTPAEPTAHRANLTEGGSSCDADPLDPQPGSALFPVSEGTSVIDLRALTSDLDTGNTQGEPPCLLAPIASQATECGSSSPCASLASHWLELHGHVSCRHPCTPMPSRLSVPLTAVCPQQQQQQQQHSLRHHSQTCAGEHTSGTAPPSSNMAATPHACTARVARAPGAAPSLRFAELLVTDSAGTRDGQPDNGQLAHPGVTHLGGSEDQHAGMPPPLLYSGHSGPPMSLDGDGCNLTAEVIKAAEVNVQHHNRAWGHRAALLLWLAAVTAGKDVARELFRTRLCV